MRSNAVVSIRATTTKTIAIVVELLRGKASKTLVHVAKILVVESESSFVGG